MDWEREGKKVLVVGIGGGSDIIAAYAVARLVRKAALVAYANTKRKVEKDLVAVAGMRHVWCLGPDASEPQSGDQHGTTGIDRLVPRGHGGCPFIFQISRRNRAQHQALAGEIVRLGYDEIVAVDIGGDCLTKETGRDAEMLAVLARTGLRMTRLVVAPGIDGESEPGALRKELRRCTFAFPTSLLLPTFVEFAEKLEETRTPRLIRDVLLGHLAPDAEGLIEVPRCLKPRIPAEWVHDTLEVPSGPDLRDLFPGRRHVFLPVVHVEEEQQARRNVAIARNAGADGVFLIMHGGGHEALLPIAERIARDERGWFVGVNCLDLVPHEVVRRVSKRIGGISSAAAREGAR